MKPFSVIVSLAAGCLACAQAANAEMISLQNWADEVVHYTSKIQNFSGEIISPATEGWVLGPSDADVNLNGYAWDDGVDQDYVAGWRKTDADQFIVVRFTAALPDVEGNDLVIHMYCGPKAEASVWASVDDDSYTQIGSIVGASGQVPGKKGYFYDAEFDFANALAGDVQYVKVQRVTNGADTGMFFDSFASTPVPEPTSLGLLMLGSLLLAVGWTFSGRRAG